MDFVELSASSRVRDGLDSMLTDILGPHDIVHPFIEVGIALLIVEISKRVTDKPEWFPKGKWATIQSIQEKVATIIEAAVLKQEKTP